MLLVSLVALGLLSQQSVPPPARCKLTRVSDKWQGPCTELLGETPTLTVSSTTSLKSGRYQKTIEPKAIYAGEIKISTGAVPVEIEIYDGGTGILRPQGLTWLVVANAVTRSDVMEFTLDVARAVPPSDLDREIIMRAASILKSEAVWDRADDRQCGADDKTYSIYCAMIRATNEVTGGIHHRRPAMEVVRQIVDARSAGRKYEHRLRDYNNDSSTTLADVRSLFEEALGRLKLSAQSQPVSRPDFSGTWTPADPARSDTLFDVGLSRIPGGGRLAISQTPNRFTVTITMPEERLDVLLNISGRFDPTIIYRVYEAGRSGGAGAGGPVSPTRTSWMDDRLVIPNAIVGAIRPVTMTFSMDGERLKMETRVEVDATRVNNTTQLFTKVK